MLPRLVQGCIAEAVFASAARRTMLSRRMPSKHGNKDYFKGNGCGPTGAFVRGRYVIDARRVRRWVFPPRDAAADLRPYVSPLVRPETARLLAIRTVADYIQRSAN